jgi:hypothetical protein
MVFHDRTDALNLMMSVGLIICAINFGYHVRRQTRLEKLANAGDNLAAREIVLPAYKNLFRGMAYFYLISAFLVFLPCLMISTVRAKLATIQYFMYVNIVVYTSIPTLFLQQFVTLECFIRTAKILSPWFIMCSIIMLLQFFWEDDPKYSMEILFLLSSTLPPLFLVYSLLWKVFTSRINVESYSFRAALFFLVVYIFVFVVVHIALDILLPTKCDHIDRSCLGSRWQFYVGFVFCALSLLWNMFFPTFLLPTLKSDTHFWTGITKKGGIESFNESTMTPVNMSMASSQVCLNSIITF